MRKSILLATVAIGSAFGSHAQSVGPGTLNAAGGTTIIGSNEFDWSIGEMTMITTISTSSVIVTQGVLQPADVTLGVATGPRATDRLQVFPNPATSAVNLQYASPAAGSLAYSLMDMSGRVISNSKLDITQGTTSEQIDLSKLAAATYMLEVTVNSEGQAAEKKSFKIDKVK